MQADPANVPVWLTTLVAAIVFGSLGAVAYVISRRRTAGLRRLEHEYGLKLYDYGQPRLKLPKDFILMTRARRWGTGEVGRLLEGEISGIRVWLFEFRTVTDPDKRTTRGYPTTVAMFEIPGAELPEFLLRPERLRHKLAAATGGQDIDFPDSPRFSRLYRLQGNDAQSIRDTLTPALRAFFESHPGRVAQCISNRLFYFRPPRLLRLASFRAKTVKHHLNEVAGLALAVLSRRHEDL